MQIDDEEHSGEHGTGLDRGIGVQRDSVGFTGAEKMERNLKDRDNAEERTQELELKTKELEEELNGQNQRMRALETEGSFFSRMSFESNQAGSGLRADRCHNRNCSLM